MGAGSEVYCFRPQVEWDADAWRFLCDALGEERMRRTAYALTRPPSTTCVRVNTLRCTPAATLADLSEAFDLIYHPNGGEAGTPEGMSPARGPYIHPVIPTAVIIPGVGEQEVDYFGGGAAPAGVKEVCVDRKAGEAVLRGADLFVPGVLGCSPDVQAGDMVAVSVVTGRMTRGTVLGSNHEGEGGSRAGYFIGRGRALMSRSQMFKGAKGVAVALVDRAFDLPPCEGLLPGRVMLQNLPSLVAAYALSPRPGARVLDMCAAPGGKTTALAALMGDRGEVVALDRSHSKVEHIRALARELGVYEREFGV